ncbi:hypothetical protein PVAP13_1KG354905 [Panicum virgatum]|uniref:Uncharacterized protein n=1 Tax=Panicum virgatum TaxID=38727 RepID=A0A8T0XVN9_PANVG|nr:hypothetical protein PVAP13_1KG354905 [Panicum virgatum]
MHKKTELGWAVRTGEPIWTVRKSIRYLPDDTPRFFPFPFPLPVSPLGSLPSSPTRPDGNRRGVAAVSRALPCPREIAAASTQLFCYRGDPFPAAAAAAAGTPKSPPPVGVAA